MMTIEKRIEALEGALEIWSRFWGFALTEHSLQEAETQIFKLRKQIFELRESQK